MDRLLEDLRTLSLAEAGALPLHREPVDVRAIASEVVAENTGRRRPPRAWSSRQPAMPTLVTSVDPVRVREILGNLVANALRHTPTRRKALTVDVRRGRTSDALLAVIDTGEGIAPADLERVFDRFHRRADSGGSGLGLAIVRDLAAAHGGTVAVTSDGVPGHGSTFLVRLPVRDLSRAYGPTQVRRPPRREISPSAARPSASPTRSTRIKFNARATTNKSNRRSSAKATWRARLRRARPTGGGGPGRRRLPARPVTRPERGRARRFGPGLRRVSAARAELFGCCSRWRRVPWPGACP